MWIRFLQDFTYKPTSQTSVDYKTGHVAKNIPHDRAAALIEKGVAEEVENGGKAKAADKPAAAGRKSPAEEKAESKPANAKGDLAKD
jgi:hypothetical protein